MSLFISQAHAAAEGAPDGGGMQMIFMLVVFAAIFYFMISIMLFNHLVISKSPFRISN